MNRVLIAVGAEFVQLQTVGRRPAIFGGGVARDPRRTLIRIRPAFCAFQRNRNAVALLSHIF